MLSTHRISDIRILKNTARTFFLESNQKLKFYFFLFFRETKMSDEEDRAVSGEEDVAQEDLDIGIPLSKDIVIRSLSRLERVGDGSQHALTKLDASGVSF